ncbi:hypothetical protein K501DRAFT_306352, partial [Backusella circina FSU 941]
MFKEWWKGLPEKYHLCDDWLDVEQCKEKIDETQDSAPLMMFIRFQIFTMDIYSCLLQPKALDSDNNQLLSMVQELMLERSLHCCQLVSHCVKRLSDSSIISPCHYLLSVSEYLFHTVDVLVMLTLSSNLTVKREANIMLKKSLDAIDGMKYMELHKVDRESSPLRYSLDGKLFNAIDLTFYDQYPRPWFAMIYDACHYLAKM